MSSPIPGEEIRDTVVLTFGQVAEDLLGFSLRISARANRSWTIADISTAKPVAHMPWTLAQKAARRIYDGPDGCF